MAKKTQKRNPLKVRVKTLKAIYCGDYTMDNRYYYTDGSYTIGSWSPSGSSWWSHFDRNGKLVGITDNTIDQDHWGVQWDHRDPSKKKLIYLKKIIYL